MNSDYDAIVVGSGISGGWAAKELTEKGLKVLMIERGPMIEHGRDYNTEFKAPWEMQFHGIGDAEKYADEYPVQSKKKMFFNEYSEKHWVNDKENPYATEEGTEFEWYRGYQMGGKSLIWGRQCWRWSDLDFSANHEDGIGVDWPIRYEDLKPWYDYVEEFIGVAGNNDGLDVLPDGKYLPPFELRAAEKKFKEVLESDFPGRTLISGRTANITQPHNGRGQCQKRLVCNRGCSFGAYFSTQSSTLPAARATGNLTLLTETVVESVVYDEKTGRASGVKTVGANNGVRQEFNADVIFLNAGTINTVGILLRSKSISFPNGLANSSGVLGHYLMDHASATSAVALFNGVDDRGYIGNRPNTVIVPRYRNVGSSDAPFKRGYHFQGAASRQGWRRGARTAGVGKQLKEALANQGSWTFFLGVFAECLPYRENKISIHPTAKDPQGLPQMNISFRYGENEYAALRDAETEARKMLEAAGAKIIMSSSEPDPGGSSIHEMGGARMGHDKRDSVVNKFNQCHDVPNIFITDGACMSSTACQNPSLTYMALTARAVDYAVGKLKVGDL
ncbi:GMC family oxidoreductase [Alteromonas sp. RKMC-009]|nr:GMC family oxidoreductase [Alteromonas sp. RKMC-009]